MATKQEKQLMRSLWPNHTLSDVAFLMKRSKSWVHRVSIKLELPAKAMNYRKRTAGRIELGKEALSLRRGGMTWQQIASKMGLCSRGRACTLAGAAEQAELSA
jgi:hypothetical protein